MAVKNNICKGVWLDQQEAIIVSLEHENPAITRLLAEIENFHPTGGSRSKTPWGPRDVVSESTYLNRKKHQLRQYYSIILSKLKDASDLFILGPAEAKMGLLKTIQDSKQFTFKSVTSQASKRLTDKQLIAKVARHFECQSR
ncbi:MAG: hypothetical protein ABJE80_01775 [Reichenbachiella sp.]|uniref:hypothetical protein n=1 Tax=Reichenbachiella sp. TaxID=2184521 RepID=UPI0032648152